MMQRQTVPCHRPRGAMTATALALGLMALALSAGADAAGPDFPITAQQRSTAQQVAQAGVPLSELAPNAPDSYLVKSGDTLWSISSLYLKSPWKWPELWGMNLEQIRNPHLIYPGQQLVLEKTGDRARLKVAGTGGAPTGNDRLSPRVRDAGVGGGPLASVPIKFIESFFNEAVILDTNEMEGAPRIVATQEGRVLLGKGDRAYVRGETEGVRDWRVFRRPRALTDPDTGRVVGWEARFVGAAEFERAGGTNDKGEIVPATFRITSAREEANLFDRLAPAQSQEFGSLVPHAPSKPIQGRIVSIYGDALNAGQNQIVSLNRGTRDGLERGHVLGLWRAGSLARDPTHGGAVQTIRLPDERHGELFVFRTFENFSYALILRVEQPVSAGDRFTQP